MDRDRDRIRHRVRPWRVFTIPPPICWPKARLVRVKVRVRVRARVKVGVRTRVRA